MGDFRDNTGAPQGEPQAMPEVFVAMIGGTGLSEFAGVEWLAEHQPETPFGKPSGPIKEGSYDGNRFFFLARHGADHSLAPHKINYRANIAALKSLGVTHILAVNAVGGLAPSMGPHTLVIPDQVIDYTVARESSFYDGIAGPLDHIDFTDPYDPIAREALLLAADKCGLACEDGGVYGCTQGPRLETAAEVRRLKQDGCDLVGMTGMPEACLAREAQIQYASICAVVNWGAGLTDSPISMEEIGEVVALGMNNVRAILIAALAVLMAGSVLSK